jgi:hypothetical protein
LKNTFCLMVCGIAARLAADIILSLDPERFGTSSFP